MQDIDHLRLDVRSSDETRFGQTNLRSNDFKKNVTFIECSSYSKVRERVH